MPRSTAACRDRKRFSDLRAAKLNSDAREEELAVLVNKEELLLLDSLTDLLSSRTLSLRREAAGSKLEILMRTLSATTISR